jgi:hypothetical protein
LGLNTEVIFNKTTFYKYSFKTFCAGTAHYIFVKVCKVIADNSEMFIQWLAREEYAWLAVQNTFPDTLGTLDIFIVYSALKLSVKHNLDLKFTLSSFKVLF